MPTYGIGYPLATLSKDVCPLCGHKHQPTEPHDAESLYFKQQFKKANGRPPTWADAIEHCPENVKITAQLMLEYLHCGI